MPALGESRLGGGVGRNRKILAILNKCINGIKAKIVSFKQRQMLPQLRRASGEDIICAALCPGHTVDMANLRKSPGEDLPQIGPCWRWVGFGKVIPTLVWVLLEAAWQKTAPEAKNEGTVRV